MKKNIAIIILIITVLILMWINDEQAQKLEKLKYRVMYCNYKHKVV